MFSSSSTPEHYRIAALRRHEDLSRAAERRRYKLLASTQPGWFDLLRNRLGQSLINVGERLVESCERPAQSHHGTAG